MGKDDPMVRIGLTGGIASGKSTASARLRQLGAVVIDHDVIAREVVAEGSAGLAAVVAAFGPGVLDEDGGLDRAALGELVFADERARADLEAIVHPLVRQQAAAEQELAVAAGAEVVVHDVPLLVESGQAGDFDVVVTVSAPEQLRVYRLISTRGMTEQEAWQRVHAQAEEAERRAVADMVLDGSGTVAELRAQVDLLWRSVTGRTA